MAMDHVLAFFFPASLMFINYCTGQSWFVRLRPVAKIVVGGAIVGVISYYFSQLAPTPLSFVMQCWMVIFIIAWVGYWTVPSGIFNRICSKK
jgi:hypothetical protein